ncbi:sensor histidine kinase [Spirochaeta dissipatitropha]
MRLIPVRRLLMLLTIIAILPALAIIIWAGFEHGASQEQDIRNRTIHDVQMLGLIQQTISTSINQTLSTIAALPAFRDSNLDLQQEILRNVLLQNPGYVNLSYTDIWGIVQTSALLETGADLSDRKHVLEALSGKSPAAGEFILALVGDTPSLPFAVPVRNRNGEIIGALTSVYRLREYARAIDSLDLTVDSLLLISDDSGRLLFSSNPVDRSGDQLSEVMLPETISLNPETIIAEHRGTRHFFALQAQTLPGDDIPYMYIFIGIPEILARQVMLATIFRNILLMIIAGLASLLIIRRIGDRFIGSGLRILQNTVQEIERGNLSARPPDFTGPCEIFRVSKGISSMAEAIEERSRERDRTELNLHKALEENKTLLREIHHRVKNNMQLMLSMVYLQRDSSPDIESFITQIETRITAMSSVHELLYESDSLARIEISIFLRNLIDLSRGYFDMFEINAECDQQEIMIDQATPLALITNELLINAAKYGKSADGKTRINLSFKVNENTAELIIRDQGPGLPADHDKKNHTTLGTTLIETLVQQISGTVSFGGDRSGTVVIIRFPLY